MRNPILLLLSIFCLIELNSQTNRYTISFENAVHHEAFITATFPNITTDTLTVRMSRTSPGRYALHEFAKNIYGFKAYDGKGNLLKAHRPDPYQWQVMGHNGTVKIEYLLFANRGDGTYSQVDETHAHLNIPATFMYAPSLELRDIEVSFIIRKDLNWKVATQLPLVSGTTYAAPNVQYFMDSPVEISNFGLKEFQVDGQTIQLALHHNGTEEELETYFEKVKKVVLAEKEVYGELPDFDYGRYTFLACYIPNASGDGMEHRNSTILTSTRGLANGGMEGNIGTVSHEFFHAWNVERIRPRSLEPFDFEEANMSGALWFAEGFTSYYTNLILCRAGLISPKEYIEGLTGTFNYVWKSPATQFFNPIEMSYQAPFVDAATSVDPVNRENTFISYYSYGSVLGLALDLSLRERGLNLDDFMKLVWNKYGKTQTQYTIEDLQNTLNEYAGKEFGEAFFGSYIYKSEMPDYESLFDRVGVDLTTNPNIPYLGISARLNGDGNGEITTNPKMGSPAYEAGLDKGDVIMAINGEKFPDGMQFDAFISQFKPEDVLKVDFERFGLPKSTNVTLRPSSMYTIVAKEDEALTKKQSNARKEWLKLP
ncbi:MULTISPECIES: M61 family metallopeptidase [Maribacter]|uniref:PDZ domain-containing protein n=1 Tax=Maribacter flavus TaxID=1658664 RepID=A0ABU7IF81_9FLAO|nr:MULTISPECIES: PDZ domain-containing protein [Maribacter]MDC6404466.1 PDZ domain-containing protein [Maribacter sp. PR66]MEE1971610.1 PDZ domain-containing protein [Maribacter flavus]